MQWTKGRGKLGMFKPLLGQWRCETDSQMGQVNCIRAFTQTLNKKYIELFADWQFDGDKNYQERCLFGVDADKNVCFWSFTNDGKQSNGLLTDVTDIHPEALGFVAEMPAGTARQFYWPDSEVGFWFAVESKTKKGWNRFLEHHFIADDLD